MSGAMRRIGEYLGLLEDTGYDEYDDEMTALLMAAGIYNRWDDDVTLPNAIAVTESAAPSSSSP